MMMLVASALFVLGSVFDDVDINDFAMEKMSLGFIKVASAST